MPKLRWVIVHAAVTFIMAVTLVTMQRELGRIERLSDALEAKVGELVELTRKSQDLEEKIVIYETPDGMVGLARKEFNMVRSGEKVFKIELISEDILRKE
ncbi:MAG: septum formation initiator family protein [Synergistaceae bacterium]|nr:septum formation initiator family protein [Synergistaceae bacterium]